MAAFISYSWQNLTLLYIFFDAGGKRGESRPWLHAEVSETGD